MPKAPAAPQLSSRILNSKGGSTSSLSTTLARRTNTSRKSNIASTQKRRHSSPVPVSRAQYTNRTGPTVIAQGGSNLETPGDDDTPPTKKHKTSKTTKVITAKEKRQAALAAAEENATQLSKAATENGDLMMDSGEEDDFGTDNDHGNRTDRLKAVDFEDASGSDDDNEEDGPEAAHRPRLTQARTADHDEDSASDGAIGLDNDDSDEDDPINSPTRNAPKKGRFMGAKFTDAAATAISSKLPVKRVRGTQKIAKQSNKISSAGLTSPAKTGATVSSSSPSPSSQAAPPKTPPKLNARRPRMGDQTPSTFGLLKASVSDIRQDLFIEDAFPGRTIFTENSKAIFLAACADVQATLHRKRFLKSDTYRGIVLAILRQKLSQVRQEARNAALAKAAIHYGISSEMESAEIIARVGHLKTKLAYVFGDTNQYKRPYANPIFQVMINGLFFEGKRKSDAITNPVPWNPMPLPVIALMATAIHSVLDDWSNGKNEAAKNKFSHDKYAPIYHDHLANLAKFKQKAPAALAKLQATLWEKAWLSSGSALPDQGNVQIDDDIFAEAEAEALA